MKNNIASESQLALLRVDARDPVVFYPDRTILAGTLLSEAMHLSTRLGNSTHVFNLCRDHHHFMVVFMASLIAKKIMVLPANEAFEALALLAEQLNNDVMCIADETIHSPLTCSHYQSFFVDPIIGELSEVPLIDENQIAVYVLTSGTTGAPRIHIKKWKELVLGSEAASQLFCPSATEKSIIVSTVPSQHMYGLETNIMWAMQGHCFVWHKKPFYPMDIAHALFSTSKQCILVSTPYHLRLLCDSECVMPKVNYIISATAPLSSASAQRAEKLFSTKLIEVYGSTETGMFAYRHTTQNDEWRCFDGISLQTTQKGLNVGGKHLAIPVQLSDELILISPTRFKFISRNNDLIKIAGKRSSIAYLNQLLLQIEGINDGSFFFPPDSHDDNEVTRLSAFVVTPNLDKQAIIAQLRPKMDAIFLPKTIFFVDALPRNGSGKLSKQAMEHLWHDCNKSNR